MRKADFELELAAIEVESIGLFPLESAAYFHVSDENATKVLFVGLPQAGGGTVNGGVWLVSDT